MDKNLTLAGIKQFLACSLLLALSAGAFAHADLDRQHQVMVLVLEIPLFSAPDTNSKILQYRRQGEVLYVKENLSEGAPWRPNYELVHYFEQESYDDYLRDIQNAEYVSVKRPELDRHNLEIARSGFFTTLDNIGRVAYIPKVFVRALTKDGRELSDSVNRFASDPMDYRRPEPLGQSYPFVEYRDLLFHAQYGLAPAQRLHQDYGREFSSENYSERGLLQIGVAKKLSFDRDRRWSFGFLGQISWQSGDFSLGENHRAQERFRRTGLGPFLGHEVYRGKYLTAEVTGGITVFPWVKIQTSEDRNQVQVIARDYQTYQVLPHVGAGFYLPPFLESQFLGLAIDLGLPWTTPVKKTFSTSPNEDELNYRVKTGPEFSVLLAFRGQY